MGKRAACSGSRPTIFSSQSTRSSMRSLLYPWTRIGSLMMSAIGILGSREAIGSWKTTVMSERSVARSLRVRAPVSFPPMRMVPSCGVRSCMISISVVVFPLPDSPTSARHSPSRMSKEMPSTARCSPIFRRTIAPLVIGKTFARSSTSSTVGSSSRGGRSSPRSASFCIAEPATLREAPASPASTRGTAASRSCVYFSRGL